MFLKTSKNVRFEFLTNLKGGNLKDKAFSMKNTEAHLQTAYTFLAMYLYESEFFSLIGQKRFSDLVFCTEYTSF
jgi:hypothetical protein